jgi:hypothetical protein
MIQSSKLMLTLVCNLYGFQVFDVIPKGEMFTTAYYIRISEYPNIRISEYPNIRNIIIEIIARYGEGERRLIVHADNARPHIAK